MHAGVDNPMGLPKNCVLVSVTIQTWTDGKYTSEQYFNHAI